jgi:hypothetical protein
MSALKREGGSERRVGRRDRLRIPVDIEVHIAPDGGVSTLVDLSTLGARVVGERVASGVGARVCLRVRAGILKRIRIPARVVWLSSHARGLEFIDPPAEATAWIRRTLAIAQR